ELLDRLPTLEEPERVGLLHRLGPPVVDAAGILPAPPAHLHETGEHVLPVLRLEPQPTGHDQHRSHPPRHPRSRPAPATRRTSRSRPPRRTGAPPRSRRWSPAGRWRRPTSPTRASPAAAPPAVP